MEILARKKGKDYLINVIDLASGVYVKVFKISNMKKYLESSKTFRFNPGCKLVEELHFKNMAALKRVFTKLEDMRNFYAYATTLRPNNIGLRYVKKTRKGTTTKNKKAIKIYHKKKKL